ncbi:MAG TPA: prolipoprotein diacylglyceryl transferase family protein, partial [Bacteroidales bacterium]|nr:prolipoprotein diacylglyceryl transferase family protein [Bacteroidales bacterium]
MDPVAFRLFGIPVMWYGVIITIGVFVGLVVLYYNSRRSNGMVSFDEVTDAFLYAFPLALVGARVYYVIFELDQYDSLGEMIDFRSGGLAIHGGILGAALGIYIYKKVKKK